MVERFYIDRFTEKDNKKLLPLNGEVFVKCIVAGTKNRKTISSLEVGKSGLTYLGNQSYFNNAFVSAKQNALYQFRTRFGISGERIINIISYWIRYPNINGYRSKRINRDGKYYTYIFDSRGKIKTYAKWKRIDKDIINTSLSG